MDESHPDPEGRWTHRLIVTYWAAAMLTATLGAGLAGAVPESSMPLVETLAWGLFAVVLSLFGGSAIEAWRARR